MDFASPRIALTVPRQTAHLALVRQVVVAAAARLGFADDDVVKIELATDEACANAVVHGAAADGPATFELTIEAEEDDLVITLRDRAPGFSFEDEGRFELAAKLREQGQGGLGVYIMRSFMDEVTYRREGEVTVTTLRKRRAAAGELVTSGTGAPHGAA